MPSHVKVIPFSWCDYVLRVAVTTDRITFASETQNHSNWRVCVQTEARPLGEELSQRRKSLIKKISRQKKKISTTAHRTQGKGWERLGAHPVRGTERLKDKDGGRGRTDFLKLGSPHAQVPKPGQKEGPGPPRSPGGTPLRDISASDGAWLPSKPHPSPVIPATQNDSRGLSSPVLSSSPPLT